MSAADYKSKDHQNPTHDTTPEVDDAELSSPEVAQGGDVQRLSIGGGKPQVTTSNILRLQQTIGNTKVMRLLAEQRSVAPTVQRHGDHGSHDDEEM